MAEITCTPTLMCVGRDVSWTALFRDGCAGGSHRHGCRRMVRSHRVHLSFGKEGARDTVRNIITAFDKMVPELRGCLRYAQYK